MKRLQLESLDVEDHGVLVVGETEIMKIQTFSLNKRKQFGPRGAVARPTRKTHKKGKNIMKTSLSLAT